MSSKDNLGDRIKSYERLEKDNFLIPMLPTIVRLDGRSFSKFTKSFEPFDEDMSNAMIETTKFLVKESNALIGYTQSDEITLILYTDNVDSQIFFNGKKHKLLSNLASLASVKFYDEITHLKQVQDLPDLFPSFDCRLFQVPTKMEAWNALLWRVQDSIKNSIQMLAQSHISHKVLQGKNQKQQLQMLDELGVHWEELPNRFKEGTFVRKVVYDKVVYEDDLERETIRVKRSKVDVVNNGCDFNKIENRIEYIFGEDHSKKSISYIDVENCNGFIKNIKNIFAKKF